ncbi:MAG TPA: S46 family peptidase [Bacteroidales bacterium]|nr:S46 family peptidase [Bacteroidales bacterium]HQB21798.1 S46 family peptidase [Bacteroidales bacterium]
MKKLIILILSSILFFPALADEGMWIPILIERYNFDDMKAKGFKLSAEDIYSINQASMKDAIVIFGGGCTGELISDQGLLITNHHCGYGQIQQHSSLENDYLTNGFWAVSQKDELANPGLKVTFLISMSEVTDAVLEGVNDNMSEQERNSIIKKNIDKIKKASVEGSHYEARVEQFYNNNQYFLFINEIFTDVRLVGAPPSAIGKFGGDTDNWMWPRHTGDFALFRIYCDKDGKPAPYSEDNVPYKPKKFFPISTKGYKQGDFTMVFGYPGTTTEYLPSSAVEQVMNETDPSRIMIRKKKLDIINAAMNSDPLIRIQYSAKAASIANGWKKWIGEINGLKRLDAVNVKKQYEQDFMNWVNADSERTKKYKYILNQYKTIYNNLSPYNLAMIYINEAGFGSDAVLLALRMRSLESVVGKSAESIEVLKKDAQTRADNHFKNYNEETDKKMFAEMLKLYYENIPQEFHPNYFAQLDKIKVKIGNKYEAIAEHCYKTSIFGNQEKFNNFLNSFSEKSYKTLMKDPIYLLMKDYVDIYINKVDAEFSRYSTQLDSLDRIYMKAQIEHQDDKVLFPDANFTLRVTYGKIDSYYPADGVKYNYFTTLEGIMEKDNPEVYDYDVPQKLRDLYEAKDYGRYADADGSLHICFTASNHTTGGNSGSPVINGNGELIGINFDRNWEGTMSDIMYDPEMCRNISIDIRYALFIIDKYAGATHLLEEMDIR